MVYYAYMVCVTYASLPGGGFCSPGPSGPLSHCSIRSAICFSGNSFLQAFLSALFTASTKSKGPFFAEEAPNTSTLLFKSQTRTRARISVSVSSTWTVFWQQEQG